MRVGIDFDNTIVSYDSVFHRVARETGLIPEGLPATKLAVRDYLRRIGREDAWTEMQGYVYGARMAGAEPFPGVLEFFGWARNEGIELAIVSHKTRHPFLGPQYDLHEAARVWVTGYLRDGAGALIDERAVFFETTKPEKLRRIAELGCDCFVDDLPEMFEAEGFPGTTRAILFDPGRHHKPSDRWRVVRSWPEVREVLE